MKIVFCIPGKQFSGEFLDCWNELLFYCIRNGIQVIVNRKYSCNIYYVRNMLLGADVSRGKNQKPFDGKIDYDFLCWIDSDTLFTTAQFQRLLNHNVDMVSALQSFEGGNGYTCGKLDEEYFKANGYMEYFTNETIKSAERNEQGLIEADYTGFGFTLIKKGVVEAMEYPYFRPEWFEIGECKDFCMEDVGFCMNVKKADFKIMIDPEVRVGHLKTAIF